MDEIKKIPVLRFPEFSGEWEINKLSELTTLITKGTTPKDFSDKGINFIKIECFEENRINKEKCVFINENTHKNELKRSVLFEGDILFAIAGATIGKCNIVTKNVLIRKDHQPNTENPLKPNLSGVIVKHLP